MTNEEYLVAFELLVGAFALLFLSYASVEDIKTREIEDKVWKWLLLASIPIYIVRLGLYGLDFSIGVKMLISVLVGVTLALIIAFAGLWGGADAKAFICLSIISPLLVYSPFSSNNRILELIDTLIPFSVTIFVTSYLLVIPLPLGILFFNIVRWIRNRDLYNFPEEQRKKKILACFVGYPSQLATLKEKIPWKYDFLEGKSPEGWKISFVTGFSLGEPEEDLERRQKLLSQAEEDNRDSVWIQPSIPFLIPLSLGYLVSLLGGNLIFLFFVQLSSLFS